MPETPVEITSERLTLGKFPKTVEREHLERYAYACGFVQGNSVADIACGTGYGSRMLKDAGAGEVVGIDLSRESIDHASTQYSSNGLHFFLGDAINLSDIPDERFDIVISFETIEHIHDAERFIGEIHRVLKSGGSLIISTPERRLASILYPLRRRPNNPFHIREYTLEEFQGLLERRFRVVDRLGQAYVHPYLVFWPVQAALKGVCYMFRGLGAYRLIEQIYHIGSGLEPMLYDSRGRMVARFWIIRCAKGV